MLRNVRSGCKGPRPLSGLAPTTPAEDIKSELAPFGATIVDALDTLFIMGLEEEFQQARGRLRPGGPAVRPVSLLDVHQTHSVLKSVKPLRAR